MIDPSELFPIQHSLPESDPVPARKIIQESLPDFKPIEFSEIYPILSDKYLDNHAKVTRLATTTLKHYFEGIGASTESFPDKEALGEWVEFAFFLEERARTDSETEIALEMLDEEVEQFKKLSPIWLSLQVESVASQYQLPATNTLVMKLWTLDNMGDADALPSHFEKIRRICRLHKRVPNSPFSSSFLNW